MLIPGSFAVPAYSANLISQTQQWERSQITLSLTLLNPLSVSWTDPTTDAVEQPVQVRTEVQHAAFEKSPSQMDVSKTSMASFVWRHAAAIHLRLQKHRYHQVLYPKGNNCKLLGLKG